MRRQVRYSSAAWHVRRGSHRLRFLRRALPVCALTPSAWASTSAPITAQGIATGEVVTCPGQTDPALTGLAGMVRDSIGNVPVPGALVVATWTADDGLPRSATAEADDRGAYRLCAIPANRSVSIQAAFTTFATRPVSVTIEPGPPAGWNFQLLVDDDGVRGDAAFPGRIVGRVVDRNTDRPVDAASIVLEGEGIRRLSEGQGRYLFDDLPPGVYRLSVTHVTYDRTEQLVNVPGNRTVEVNFAMSVDPIELEPIVVTIVRDRRLEIKGFYERRELGEAIGNGVFFDQEEIRRQAPLRVTHLLERVPGVRISCTGSGNRNCMVRMTGGTASLGAGQTGCTNANVFVDGVRVIRDNQAMPESLDVFVSPGEVAGLEVYRGAAEIPAEFGGSTGQCGAIVIWTGRGDG